VFNLCTDEGTTVGPDSTNGCFASIKVGSMPYTLQQTGKGVPLGTALNHSCPTVVPGKPSLAATF